MDWMYANCSTTAQRGAFDWWKNSVTQPSLYLQNYTKAWQQVMNRNDQSIRTASPITAKSSMPNSKNSAKAKCGKPEKQSEASAPKIKPLEKTTKSEPVAN